VRCGEET